MTYNTINDAVTMQGGGGALLAGRYRIVRQLGQGGMGSVWLAEDTQLDGKLFAIKMLPSILVSNKRAYRQLKDEALVAMKLTHPNIVTLRAFEENNGNPFLVMDYVDGETLDDYLAEHCEDVDHVEHVERVERGSGGLPEDEVIRILKPIAAALDYAHGEGVVHRDVKPANVMIRKDGHPYILDFGIAREIQETMTRVTGKLSSGTLLYMSPEQLRGLPPKPAQDVYSFAAMVYECLKGEPPFSRGQIEYQILNEQPQPIDSHISGQVLAGLAKNSENRPNCCSAVIVEEAFVSGGDSQSPAVRTCESVTATNTRVLQESAKDDVSTLILLRAKIKIKADEARVRMEQLSAYRGDEACVKSHIENADASWRIANAVEIAPKNLAEAEATLNVLADTVAKIDSELEWLKANAMAREGAVALVPEIANGIVPELIRYNAEINAHEACLDGQRSRMDGESALAIGDFINAKKKLAAARDKFTEAVAISKDACVKQHIDIARQLATAGRWSACLEKCDLILGLDPSNVDARELKDETERNLVPMARLSLLVDGEPLGTGVSVKIGKAHWDTPIILDRKDIEAIDTTGKEILCLRAGKLYCGRFKKVAINWHGTKEFVVELKECIVRHGDIKSLVLPDGVEIEMIYCAPGEFYMGSDDLDVDLVWRDKTIRHEKHRVRISKGFWLGRFPVTQRQWRSVMGSNPSRWCGDDLPVENVSWNDCSNFIKKLNSSIAEKLEGGARFPTEAEWEYACRAGVEACDEGDIGELGWDCSNSNHQTHPVGKKRANAWGFYDMHGNVWEWCSDWYGDYQLGNVNDPTGPESGTLRVLRGGCWDVFSAYCRSSSRGRFPPQMSSANTGFRLCCSEMSSQ